MSCLISNLMKFTNFCGNYLEKIGVLISEYIKLLESESPSSVHFNDRLFICIAVHIFEKYFVQRTISFEPLSNIQFHSYQQKKTAVKESHLILTKKKIFFLWKCNRKHQRF